MYILYIYNYPPSPAGPVTSSGPADVFERSLWSSLRRDSCLSNLSGRERRGDSDCSTTWVPEQYLFIRCCLVVAKFNVSWARWIESPAGDSFAISPGMLIEAILSGVETYCQVVRLMSSSASHANLRRMGPCRPVDLTKCRPLRAQMANTVQAP